jgi:hypothetical protein
MVGAAVESMSALRKSFIIEPMSWSRHFDNDIPPHLIAILVVCSGGHPSTVQHNIHDDGSVVAPEGYPPSMHCGTCNESFPLMLTGWTPTVPANCPQCSRGMDVSDGALCCVCASVSRPG